jgi:hypothetical protein
MARFINLLKNRCLIFLMSLVLGLLWDAGANLGAFFIIPLIALAFLGTGFISPLKLLLALFELVVGPLSSPKSPREPVFHQRTNDGRDLSHTGAFSS